MFENAIEVLKLIEKKGFKAYIVGGYVRDIYLSRTSTDIDICTSAKPKDLVKIFKRNVSIDEEYGSVKLDYKKSHFEITTFRKDIKYKDNRRPSQIEYVEKLEEDLLRRDFTINTMCMDSNGNIIDTFNAKRDIASKVIKSVTDSKKELEEDSLRILRAIRFATTLDFKIDKDLEKAIKKHKKNLENLSFHRKKSELNHIFRSNNYEYGIKLINKYRLNKELEISKLNKLKKTTDVLGMWAQIDYSDNYPFSKLEKETIKQLREILLYGKIDVNVVYKYGIYTSMTVGEILGVDKKDLLSIHESLKIHSKEEIVINIMDIANILKKDPCKELRDIMTDIENNIVCGKLDNKREDIEEFIFKKYGGDK